MEDLPTDFFAYIQRIERQVIVAALELHDGNRTKAGMAMGMNLRQMRYAIDRLGIKIVLNTKCRVTSPDTTKPVT